ncbi:MAG TPA: fumarylacetoacetate hydrolase family protein [Dehalococcoidia bacterium]|nr:fumarylacetoacetate hydrolase family protein [Dehalococcoidia bacterium]
MIWCRFQVGDDVRYGMVEGDQVLELEGSPFGEHRANGRSHDLSAVKLLVPVVPSTFYCAGINYRGHVIKMAAMRGEQPVFPNQADIGYRANNALIAHGEPIVIPRDASDEVQYEGELVAVFGKKARNVSIEDALDYVLGWTIGNDVSERVWQRNDRTFWRSKNTDTFKPMGPWIVTGAELDGMRTIVRLNGRVVEDFATADMIFSAQTFIHEVTKYNTIYPGDVMWLGTDGVPENIKHGDTVEVEITGVGVLSNPVVRET